MFRIILILLFSFNAQAKWAEFNNSDVRFDESNYIANKRPLRNVILVFALSFYKNFC